MACRLAAHGLGVSEPPRARAGVGIAAVDDHRLDLPPPQPLHTDQNGRGFDRVGGEERGGGGGNLREDQGKVFLPALLDAAGDAGELKSRNFDGSHVIRYSLTR